MRLLAMGMLLLASGVMVGVGIVQVGEVLGGDRSATTFVLVGACVVALWMNGLLFALVTRKAPPRSVPVILNFSRPQYRLPQGPTPTPSLPSGSKSSRTRRRSRERFFHVGKKWKADEEGRRSGLARYLTFYDG